MLGKIRSIVNKTHLRVKIGCTIHIQLCCFFVGSISTRKKIEAGWPSVAEAILKLVAILLPLIPKCWGYSHDLPCPSLTGQMITNQHFFDGNLSPLKFSSMDSF